MGTDRRSSKYQKSCHVGFIVEGRGVGSQPACIFLGGKGGGNILLTSSFQLSFKGWNGSFHST